MKRLALILIVTMLFPLGMFSQKTLRSSISEDVLNDATVVVVNKAMFRFLEKGSIGISNVGGVKTESILPKLDRIEIINAENPAVASRLRKEVKSLLVEKNGYEIFIEAKDKGETTLICGRKIDGGKNEIVLYNDEGDELSIVVMCGLISFDDLQNME